MPVKRQLAGSASSPLLEVRSSRKQLIVEVAQELFSRYGYRGVSLRDIASRAGVSLTLLNHHFGAKHQLFVEVVSAWSGLVDESLVELKELAAKGPGSAQVDDVVDALMASVARLGEQPRGREIFWMNVRSRHDDDPIVSASLMQLFMPLARAFADALATVAPGAPREQLAWAYLFVRGALIERTVSTGWASAIAEADALSNDVQINASLRSFLIGGLRSLLSSGAH
jgi:AcrR family transcriptional regulator